MSEIESYLEDNRPTLDEVCEEYKECTEKCPAWKFCKAETEYTWAYILQKKNYRNSLSKQHQIEPLRSCEWAEQGGDGHIHILCPKWVKKGESEEWQEKKELRN